MNYWGNETTNGYVRLARICLPSHGRAGEDRTLADGVKARCSALELRPDNGRRFRLDAPPCRALHANQPSSVGPPRRRDFAGPKVFASWRISVSTPDRCGYGGSDRDRTDDRLLAKQMLSQLSYAPKCVVPRPGIEPGRTDFQSAALPAELPRRIDTYQVP